MHFRVERSVEGLVQRGFSEPITYDLVRSTATQVSIQKIDTAADESENKSVRLMCSTTRDVIPTDGLQELNASIAKSTDGVNVNLRDVPNDKVQLIYAIVDPVFKQLLFDLEDSTMLLKWRYGITDSPFKAFSARVESVSLDGSDWRSISPIRRFKIVITDAYSKIASVADDIERMHKSGVETPLAFQLLAEARSQIRTHPRSALVIGVAAAEIALKQLIADLVPDTRWLVEKLPSPPAFQIARDYIPTLNVKANFRDKGRKLPEGLLARLKNAVELRNKTVHAGFTPPDFETLTGIVRAMEDIVWICSLYAGYPWAANFISYETKSTWQ